LPISIRWSALMPDLMDALPAADRDTVLAATFLEG
jgi:hypothetical protein